MKASKYVGIWLRVSTDMQVKDDSPEHHERRARLYAEAKGWEVVEVYRLEAVSGKSVMGQPETIRMLSDIRSGHITALIFSKLARLARNTKELLEFADIFKEQEADLVSLAECIDTSSPAGRLFYTMIAAMATWEREEIADRVAASVPIRASMGKPLGGQASFGYRWNKKQLEIAEKEAPVRKLLYELFLQYKRKKTVAIELNRRGHRTRNGGKFSDTTVNRLLRDSMAKGQRVANYSKSLGEGKKWVIKPKKDWVVFPCPAIVSEEIWDQCNQILDTQENKRMKPGRRPVHLLSGYVYCTCGKRMYVYHEKTATYRCKPCKVSIPSADIDEFYYNELKSFLLTEKDVTYLRQQTDATLLEKQGLLNQVRQKIPEIQRKKDEYIELRVKKELSPTEFADLHHPLREQLKQLNDQIPELEAAMDWLKIQYMSADSVLVNAKNLYDRWPILPLQEKRSIVETITNKLTVGKSDIHIQLAYAPPPTPPPLNRGKRQHEFTDSWKRSA